MSRLDHTLSIEPGKYEDGSKAETFVSSGHGCPHCGGRGKFMPYQTDYNTWEQDTCKVCNGTGKLKAAISLQWSSDGSINQKKEMI